jgi:hypothetical protein
MTITLVVISTPALGLLNSGQTDLIGQSPGQQYPINQQFMDGQYPDQTQYGKASDRAGYSITVPSGSPAPVAPSNPESLGIQIPSEPATSYQAPLAGESKQALIPINEPSASIPTAGSQIDRYNHPAQSMMVISPGIGAPNKLYVASVPQTVASCSLYGWLPIWVQTQFSGPIWIYEWYPNGWLDVKYLGQSYPGWHKSWFYGDTPGWHILQFYSGGWSNYIYIYVYGSGLNWWYGPGPNPEPWLDSDVT